MDAVDVLVVGGGMAGASVAHALVSHGASVLLAEAEPVLAQHTTGRSAAMFLETYGPEQTRRLTAASRGTFERAPGLDRSLLTRRGFLFVGGAGRAAQIVAEARRSQELAPEVELLDRQGIQRLCPVLRPEHASVAVWDPQAADIDVSALHQAYIAGLRQRGGLVRTSAPVTAVLARGPGWLVTLGGEQVAASRIVNAAGAWADELARLAEVPPVGLTPMRRTAFTVPTPPDLDPRQVRKWPLVHDEGEGWYFKPEGDGLLCSLAEEEPSPPADVRAREIDVALAMERLSTSTTLTLRTVNSTWAGLRTFAPDRELVLGPDPAAPSFSWFAGLGGVGIQTAPAAGALVAALTLEADPPPSLSGAPLDVAALSPRRFLAGH